MKFNNKVTSGVTHEGAPAILLSDKVELIKLCLTSFLEESFYETRSDVMNRLNQYTDNVDTDFMLKLAVFSREYGLRSINHYLVAKYIIRCTTQKGIRKKLYNALSRMVRRPDEFAEIIKAIEYIKGSKYLPNSLKNVIKDIFESGKFDAYQIAKYRSQGDMNLFDVVNLTHPKGEVFDKLMKGTLESADTWEVNLSSGGDKKEVFERQLSEGKLGTKALLMNMRGMIEARVNQNLIHIELLKANMKGIFPFDIMKALWYTKELQVIPEIIKALEDLAYKSFENLPLEGKTAVLVDTSGSMSSRFGGERSNTSMVDVGAFYGALVAHRGYDVWAWATDIKKIDKWNGDSLLRIMDAVKRANVGMGTNLANAINQVKDTYDNVLVFSDMQTATYVRSTGAIKKLFLFDLSGYQNSIAIKGNMIQINGFNDMMFRLGSDLLNINPLVTYINSIEL